MTEIEQGTHEEALGAARWWLNLQIGLGLAGGATWFVGAMLEYDFISGVGLGLILAALVLRFGRTAAEQGPGF